MIWIWNGFLELPGEKMTGPRVPLPNLPLLLPNPDGCLLVRPGGSCPRPRRWKGLNTLERSMKGSMAMVAGK